MYNLIKHTSSCYIIRLIVTNVELKQVRYLAIYEVRSNDSDEHYLLICSYQNNKITDP